MSKKKPATPAAQSPLAAMLQTADPAEQAARVEALIQSVQNPPFSMLVTHDPRTGRTSVALSASVTYDAAQAALALAQAELREREKQALLQQAQATGGAAATDG